MDAEQRLAEAEGVYQAGLENVRTKPEPKGQKFPCGSRVRIADNLGPYMSHFPKSRNATVEYTYAHAYGGTDIYLYSLDIDELGSTAWYYEEQLTAI